MKRNAQNRRQNLSSLTELALRFRDERDWKQFHNPKDMALSLVLEATEVLELMQWKSGRELEKHLRARREDLSDELADVLYWVLVIANDYGIDAGEAFVKKLDKSAKKYPVAKARGKAKKYTEL
jgi:dCTP diphosphatase